MIRVTDENGVERDCRIERVSGGLIAHWTEDYDDHGTWLPCSAIVERTGRGRYKAIGYRSPAEIAQEIEDQHTYSVARLECSETN